MAEAQQKSPPQDDGSGEAPRSAEPAPTPASMLRIAGPRSAREITVLGRHRSPRDIYHWLLEAPWSLFALVVASAYLVINVVFAVLYRLDPTGLTNDGAKSLLAAFFFSVETLGAVGYGVITPASLYAHCVMALENFTGLSLIAVGTGVIFARVSRPTARILFTSRAVIAPYDGAPTLMFRVANERVNQILEAEVQISVARQLPTQEGRVMRRLQDLAPVRGRTPLFGLTWTVLHRLDEQSPLHGCTPESLAHDQAEIIVVLSGVDEGFADRIHARHSYLPHEVLWNRQFADILSIDQHGRRRVDYTRFDDLEPEGDGG